MPALKKFSNCLSNPIKVKKKKILGLTCKVGDTNNRPLYTVHILFGVSTFREDPDSKAETSRLEGELAEEFFQ